MTRPGSRRSRDERCPERPVIDRATYEGDRREFVGDKATIEPRSERTERDTATNERDRRRFVRDQATSEPSSEGIAVDKKRHERA
jgi:hypothetical protein